MKELFNKLFKAIGNIIPHSRGAKLVSLDKNYTNTYNYAYNYMYFVGYFARIYKNIFSKTIAF